MTNIYLYKQHVDLQQTHSDFNREMCLETRLFLLLFLCFQALAMPKQKLCPEFMKRLLLIKSTVSLGHKKTEDIAKFIQLQLAAMETGVKLQEALGSLAEWEQNKKDFKGYMALVHKTWGMLKQIRSMKEHEEQLVTKSGPSQEELGKDENEQPAHVALWRLDAASKFSSGLQLEAFHDIIGHAATQQRESLIEQSRILSGTCGGHLPEGSNDWHAKAEDSTSVKDILKLANQTIVKCEGARIKDALEKIHKDCGFALVLCVCYYLWLKSKMVDCTL